MKKWIFLGVIITCALLQITILDYLKILNVKPDLLFISVVAASIFLELRSAILLSICAGILKDALSINILGINTLLFPLTSFIIIKLSQKISLDNNLRYMVSAFIIMLLNDIIARAVFFFFGDFISWGIFLRTAFVESLYTASVLPLVFKVIKPIFYLESIP